MNDLPILDVSDFYADPDSKQGNRFAHSLRTACHETGFCYIIDEKLTPQNVELMRASKSFFRLALDARKKLAMIHSPQFRGYTLLGDERTQGISDWRDQIDFGLEKPQISLADGDPQWLQLRGPNLWPAEVPEMPDKVLSWMNGMDRLGMNIMRALARSFDHPLGHFDYIFAPQGDARMKLIRYQAQNDASDTGQGVGWHHDTGMLSFILQDRIGGLQIEVDGKVSDVKPVAGAFVMNLGEMLQTATNGYLRATQHRVVSPPSGKERYSIAYFFNPRLEAKVEPVPLPENLASQTNGFQNVDPDDPVFAVYGENSLKSRFRAHPDVAKRYYK
jgi:isopenicillin N synthase-like dioxygenase